MQYPFAALRFRLRTARVYTRTKRLDLEKISYCQVVIFSMPVRSYVRRLTTYVPNDGFQFCKFVNARFTSRLETIVKVYSFTRFP